MFDFALKIFLFLAPIFYWRNLPLAQVQLQFFQFGVIFLFLVALSQPKQRDLKDKSLCFLGLVCLLNCFIAQTPLSKIAILNIVFAFLLYYLIVCYTKNIKSIFKIFLILSIVNIILALSQKLGFDFVYEKSSDCCGLLGTVAYHGDFQAIIVPLAIYINPFLIVFPVAGAILAKSATPLLALVIGLSYYLIKKRFGMIYILSLFSALLGFILYYRELLIDKVTMRLIVWAKALDLIFERPFEGWGFGSIKGFAKEFTWPQYATADRLYNDYLEFGLCIGIIGLIFLSIYICNKIKRYKRSDKDLLLNTVFASCLIASIICLSHSPMAPIFSGIGQSPRIAIVIITVFAMLEILLQEKEM